MKTDPLLEIFYKHFKKNKSNFSNKEEFVYNVVADYMFYLMNQGHIPAHQCDPLEVDLKEEVIELYEKIIAGPMKAEKMNSALQPSKSRRLN